MFRTICTVLAIVVTAAIAAAQGNLQPPPGWSRSSDAGGIVLKSPADAAGWQVVYAIRPVEPVAGSVETWFGRIVARVIGGSAVLQRSGQRREQTILKEAVLVRRADGTEIRIDAMAYATPQGQQMMVVVFPAAIGAGDARVNQAYDHFAALWRSGYRLASAGSPAGQPSAQPRARPAPSSPPRTARPSPPAPGKNCRREPVWGQRISAFCKPSGICSDRVIEEYRTVCS